MYSKEGQVQLSEGTYVKNRTSQKRSREQLYTVSRLISSVESPNNAVLSVTFHLIQATHFPSTTIHYPPCCNAYKHLMRPSAYRLAETIASEGSANSQVVSAAAVGSAIETVSIPTAGASNDGMHVDDQVIVQLVALIVAEVRGLAEVVNLLSTCYFLHL
jgi:hypothetical protein